ncbi:MAG: class I SAM-dependent methyltransferase [Pyrinomonadaceae bacterium]|nr:class I SAM-dependent methyltransferase [Pyrinomonadaceae bacterium]
MKLLELKKNWNEFGRLDPLWAILAEPDKQNHGWNVEEFFMTGERDVEAILKYIEALPFTLKHGAALDFGCGVGRLTQALSARFDYACGVDIARSMIQLAKKLNRHGRRCRYFLNERDDLRLFKSATFDFVCSLITLQHMKPAYSKNYILELLRTLAPGGLLFFQLPSRHKTNPALQPDENEEATPSSSKERRKALGLYERALELYRDKVSAKEFEPVMEMYAVPRDEVLKLIQDNGGKVINVQDDFSCGPDWVSFRYFITK